jgi:phosphoglycerate dehydrogenase-like enzyme
MTLNICFPKSASPLPLDQLAALLPPEVTLISVADMPPADCDILVHGFPERAWLEACPALRAVIVPFAGVPAETQALLRDFPPIDLHNLHYNDTPTAEFAVALMLAAAKLIVPFDQALRRGNWSARYSETPTEIMAGKTAVILGYGMIGRRIAPVCQALGMHVVGVRRRQPEIVEERGVEMHGIDALHELLPRADVLHCVLPGTPHTTGLIGARELALLPAHAIVVNVGRGAVIEEEVLFTALRDRRIRAAGIDVWYNYPHTAEERMATQPSRFPFHTLDNVVLSPHRAGWLSAAEDNRLTMLAELLNAAAAGQPMPSKVDKDLGY